MTPRQLAYARLGVTEEDTLAQPQITPQLRMIAKTIRRAGQPKVTRKLLRSQGTTTLAEDTAPAVPYSPGSDLLTSWPHYLHASDDPDAKKMVQVYYAIPAYQRRELPIEAFCLAAGVPTSRVLELITVACVRLGAQASTIIAAVSHPSIVQKTVEMALTDDGIEDRAVLHKAVGFTPLPKSNQTNISVTQNASATTAVANVSAPSPESTIRTLAEAFNQRRGIAPTTQDALPAIRDTLDIATPAHAPVAVEAEYDNEEDE